MCIAKVYGVLDLVVCVKAFYLYCLRPGAAVKYVVLVTSILCSNIQRVLTLGA